MTNGPEHKNKMADLQSYPDTDRDSLAGLDDGSTAGAPLWLKALGIGIGVGFIVLLVILHLTGVVGPGTN